MTTSKLWTVQTVENGTRREDYIFLQSRLIMKRWYVNGQRVQSRMFHESEGVTQFTQDVRMSAVNPSTLFNA